MCAKMAKKVRKIFLTIGTNSTGNSRPAVDLGGKEGRGGRNVIKDAVYFKLAFTIDPLHVT